MAGWPVWLPTAPPSLAEYLSWNPQPIPLLPMVAVLSGALYLAGAVRLWRRGTRWSVVRTLSFLAGCAALAVVMGAGIEGYGFSMFSVFMFQQLTLMMAVPPLLVYGSPGTLLLRATPRTGLGRPVLAAALGALRSRWARIALHPVVAVPLFLLSFYGLYFSSAADVLLSSWVGHNALEVVFLLSGILFTVPIMSRDPLPVRQPQWGRLLDLFAEMPLHAFFGVIVMMSPQPLVRYFRAPPQWGVDPLADQGVAGGLAWSYGELPSLLIVLLLLVRWQREDTSRTRLADARADVVGTPDLDAYNDYLDMLGRRREQR